MKNESARFTSISKILLIGISLLIFSRSLVPFIQIIFSNTLLLILILLWLIVFLTSQGKIKKSKYLFILSTWLIITLCITLITQNLRFTKNFVYELGVFLFPLLVFYNDKNNPKVHNFICKITLLFGMISSIYFIIVLFNNGSDYLGRTEYGYIVAYTNVFFANIMLGEFFRNKRSKKVFNLMFFLVFSFTILLMGFTTAMLALFISLFFNTVHYIFNAPKNKWIMFCLFSAISIIVFIFSSELVSIILNIFENTIYYDRLSGLINYLVSDQSTSLVLDARIDKYLNSFNSFLQHPIFGVIWYSNDSTPILDVIGYHSYFLDVFALFGFGLGIMACWLVLYPLVSNFRVNKRYNHVLISSFLGLVIILLFNNQVPALGIVLFYTLSSFYQNSKGMI